MKLIGKTYLAIIASNALDSALQTTHVSRTIGLFYYVSKL